MELTLITEVFESVAAEMSSDPAGMVLVSPEIRERAVRGDDTPLFGTYVIESGWSKNKRFWPPELFSTIAQEMQTAASIEPFVGYLGHIRPDDDAYVFPEIQLQWVGAKLLPGVDKARLAVKAYFLPGTKARDYAERGLARAVSWKGKAVQEVFQQGVRIKDFSMESIDLARPRTAGMSARLVALTTEMEQEDNSVKPEEIAALAENELRAHNPTLVTTIESGARKPIEDKVTEMENTASESKRKLDLIPSLRSILGLDDNSDDLTVLNAAISSIRETGKKLHDTVLDSVLTKKFKSQDTVLLRRVLVGEMRSKAISLTGRTEDDEKNVGEMVDTIINGDESLKKIVSEMEEVPAAPPGAPAPPKGNQAELKAGTETTNLRVRSLA